MGSKPAKPEPIQILMMGAPSSGKTTAAASIAKLYPSSPMFNFKLLDFPVR